MVDRAARDEALSALTRFLACEITNDDYDSEYPHAELFGRKASRDVAIKAIYGVSWSWFDDLQQHKLEGKWELDSETKDIASRCCEFLRSDLEYEWRETNFIGTGFVRSVLTTLGLRRTTSTVTERLAAHLDQPQGDASVWPFFRRIDLEHTQTQTGI